MRDYEKGFLKDIHPELREFLKKHSPRLCPNGKYDNKIICSQVELIRFYQSQLKKRDEENKGLMVQMRALQDAVVNLQNDLKEKDRYKEILRQANKINHESG